MSRTQFIVEMVDWINARLAPPGVCVEPGTPLFTNRVINSIKILELIAWTERAIGRSVPDTHIRLDNFHSVERIAAVFVQEANDAAA